MKYRFIRLVFIVFAVAWAIVIFAFSARNADLSTEDSNRVGFMVGRILHNDFNEWPEADRLEYADRIERPVRKTAHVTEYMILGVFLAGACFGVGKKSKDGKSGKIGKPDYNGQNDQDNKGQTNKDNSGRPYGDYNEQSAKAYSGQSYQFIIEMIMPIMIGILYATSDEIHQHFVPGRSMQITDVFIDSLGVLIGVVLMTLLLRRIINGKKVN